MQKWVVTICFGVLCNFYQQYERTTANDFTIFTMTSFSIDALLETEKKGNFYH